MSYHIIIAELSDEDGGGFVGVVPDLPGCMSDGSTSEEALRNTEQAIVDWCEAYKQLGRQLPEPGASLKRAEADRARFAELERIVESRIAVLDDKLSEVLRELREVNDNLENQDRWERFAELAGAGMPAPSDLEKKSLC